MATKATPQLLQACKRWSEDTVLMNLLREKEQEALQMLADNVNADVNQFRLIQGTYKATRALREFIEQGAVAHAVQGASVAPRFLPPTNVPF
jgi:hypothetical protein